MGKGNHGLFQLIYKPTNRNDKYVSAGLHETLALWYSVFEI